MGTLLVVQVSVDKPRYWAVLLNAVITFLLINDLQLVNCFSTLLHSDRKPNQHWEEDWMVLIISFHSISCLSDSVPTTKVLHAKHKQSSIHGYNYPPPAQAAKLGSNHFLSIFLDRKYLYCVFSVPCFSSPQPTGMPLVLSWSSLLCHALLVSSQESSPLPTSLPLRGSTVHLLLGSCSLSPVSHGHSN